MIFLTMKMSLKLGMKWRLVIVWTINPISSRDKLSIQFPILGKKVPKQSQIHSSNLVLLDH